MTDLTKSIYEIRSDKYESCYQEDLKDISGRGLVLKHKKSGARVCLVQNDDNNKVFLIGFRTPPSDSTGVPHIIEHTVLCGSKKYPVKDPFIELAKGSLNTFLNAMTFPDRTLYPVASCNEKDIKNLSDVYMDAVFNPNIYKFEEIFKQEGWRYELESADAELTINGVVYNEMKGAYSSPEDVLEYKTMAAMFPSVTYGLSSGGDPDVIPELTYQGYLDFHRKYYHPSNSYIYLYGDFDFEERLKWLDEEYLCNYDETKPNSEIPLESPQAEIKYVTDEYPVTDDEETEGKSYLSFNAVMGDALEVKEHLAWDVLSYVLFTAQGAPVKQALVDANLGKDIWASYNNYLRQAYFNVVVKDTDPDKMDQFESILREELLKQAENGLDKDALLGAINTMEFRYIEGESGNYPKGLLYAFNVFTTWNYSDKDAFLTCHGRKLFAELREEIEGGYFEFLIYKLLENTNVVMHTLVPVRGLNVKKENELKEKLAKVKASLTSDQVDDLVKATKDLKAFQEAEDSEEAKKTLPVLKVADVNPKAPEIHNQLIKHEGLDILWHEESTNGISYIKFMFDISDMAPKYMPYASLLAAVLNKKLDTLSHSLNDLATQINIHTGSIGFTVSTFSEYKNPDKVMIYLKASTKVFTDEINNALAYIDEILTESVLDDKKRIKEILGEELSGLQMSLINAGHRAAMSRAKSYFNKEEKLKQAMYGIDMYYLLKDLYENFDEKAEELVDIFKKIVSAAYIKKRMFVDITSEKEGLEELKKYTEDFTNNLPAEKEAAEIFTACDEEFKADAKNEAYKISGQVQYCASAGDFQAAGLEFTGGVEVAKTILAYDYLWTNVRVLGGAYGCMSEFDDFAGTCGLVSYRDPNLTNTYKVFKEAADYFRNLELTKEEVDKYIIGTMSNKEIPKSPVRMGDAGLNYYLTKRPVELIQKNRDQILSASLEDIKAIADLLEVASGSGYICTVGSESAIEKDKDLFKEIKKF